MATSTCAIAWRRGGDEPFVDRRYSRAHAWAFDGGAEVHASSSPAVVPLPFSDPAGVDPEEAFVAALASCHMLWFLDLAARAGYVVDSYHDEAVGELAKNAQGKLAITRVALRPRVAFGPGGKQPDDASYAALHHRAHDECFLATSVTSEFDVQGSWTLADASLGVE